MAVVASSSPKPGSIGSNPHGMDETASMRGTPALHAGLPGRLTPRSDVASQDEAGMEEDLPEPVCGGCKKMIDEESADAGVIHFATQLWHVDCFRCAKCRDPVTTDRDDILLLSDGQPICGQCNYSCQICNLPIMEEAIMTGDESYHASCFVCRSCRTPIAELVFAKTSQGIYCMMCHNQRVARSRRHAEKKRAAAAAAAASAADGSGRSPNLSDNLNKKMPSTPSSVLEPKSPTVSLTPGSPRTDSATNPSERGARAEVSASSSSMSTLSPFLQSSSSSSITRPSSAGHGGKRPLNAPPPTSVRGSRKDGLTRPATADPSGDQSGHAPMTTHALAQQSTLAKLVGDPNSPLLASALEHATTSGKWQKQADSDRSDSRVAKAEQGGRSSDGTMTLGSSSDHGRTSGDGARKEISGLGIGLQDSTNEFGHGHSQSTPSAKGETSVEADGTGEADDSHLTVQYKRASRLNVKPSGGVEDARLSRAFSFYDPDIVGLMDSFGRFDSYEELSLDSAVVKKAEIDKKKDEEPTGANAAKDESVKEVCDHEDYAGADKPESPENKNRGSVASLSRLSETMRKSIRRAHDGHVSMDTGVLEDMLDELDATRERMKTLQRKYESIRRASQQAAQGFSSAREEYEQEVQARYDAEADMLKLKRQLHLQASKLAEVAAEKRQQESLQRRNHEVKGSIQDMEKDLAKLRIERDMTVAEVAELVAMQDGRHVTNSGHEDAIKRNLIARLDSVKEKYRNEIESLTSERDTLLIEIEELSQSRDVFAEETQTLNARNEELSSALALLQRRVEHAQAAEKLTSQQRSLLSSQPPSSTRSGGSAFAFGFGGAKQLKTPGSATSTAGAGFDGFGTPSGLADPLEQLAIASPVPVPVTKIEAAPKKFKWMKTPKLTAETARNAGQHIAAALPGVSPPVPPKGVPQPIAFSSQHQAGGELPQSSIGNQQHASHVLHQHKPSQDQLFNNGHNGMSPGEIVVKEHLFQPFNVLRPVRCFACQKNMWGQSEMKCSFCHQACHVRCLHNLPVSCNQPFSRSDEATLESSGPPIFGRSLVDQMRAEGGGQSVPHVVEKCVDVVEIQGMDYEGIYRKSGGTSQLKIITQLFEKGHHFNLDDRDRFNDISAITSVLKNYFRELPEPLLTFDMHDRFIECTESKSKESSQRKATMRELIHSLPREHFDTLRFLIEHLHRVQARSEENRMNSRNLGVVFGPTLMRSRDPTQEFAHMGGKAMTIEFIIDHPDLFD